MMNLSTLVQINSIKASEQSEADVRSSAMFIGYYSENGPTADPSGKYLCGTCKARVGKNKCAWVEGKISMQTGSCMLYMIGEPSEKTLPKKMSQTDSKYTERPNVKAFGCTRCEYGKKVSPDSSGRNYYCSFWKMQVMSTACCMMNEGKDDVFAPADNGEMSAGGPGSGRHKIATSIVNPKELYARNAFITPKGIVYSSNSLDHSALARKAGYTRIGHEEEGLNRFEIDKALEEGGVRLLNEQTSSGISFKNSLAKDLVIHALDHVINSDKVIVDFLNSKERSGKTKYWSGRAIKVKNEIKQYFDKDIHAGGSGSGCHGPNCGRPGSGSKAQQTSGTKWSEMTHEQRIQYVKEHTQVGNKSEQSTRPKATATNEKIYPHSGRGAMGVGRPANAKPEERLGKVTGPKGAKAAERKEAIAAPIYKKSFDRDAEKNESKAKEEMTKWREKLPPTQDKGTHSLITEGALVKNNTPIKAFDNDKLEFKNYKPGTILTVQNVLPSIGNNPRMVSVKFPQGDIIHVPETQLDFHKTAESQKEKPVYEIRREIGLDRSTPRPGKVAQETRTGTGEKYYKLKPEAAGRPTGSGNFMKKPVEWSKGQPQPTEHPLKGQFSLARGPHGNKMSDVFTLDLNLKSFGQGTARATVFDANRKDGSGSTVIAWRDTVNKTGKVMEFDRDQHGYVKLGSAPAVKFNNVGHMGSYLSKRYDISLKLPGDSVAKKGRRK